MELEISLKQYDLMKKITQEAVAYINQISLREEMSSEEKKQQATQIAINLATTFSLSPKYYESFSNLIESVIWDEEDSHIDDDDDDDDELM